VRRRPLRRQQRQRNQPKDEAATSASKIRKWAARPGGWPPKKPVTLLNARSVGESLRHPIYPFFRPWAVPAPAPCNPMRRRAYGLGIFWPRKIPLQAKAGGFGVPMVNLGFFWASQR
jgi:hypothetical protein